MPKILDSTLREGEQRFGAFFSVADKLRLATSLQRIVDYIEVGSPLIAPSYEVAAKELSSAIPKDQLVFHCWLSQDTILAAHRLGAKWIGLFVSIRQDVHELRYGRPLNSTLERVVKLLKTAKGLGLNVRVTCEDASRTSIAELSSFYRLAIAGGADRIGFADTVGILNPRATATVLDQLRRAGIPLRLLHLHFHNDCGFADANAEVASSYDVACIDGTLLGIGERIGITNTRTLISIEGRSSTKLGDAEALVSRNLVHKSFLKLHFAHKAGIHVDGVLKEPSLYEWTTPSSLGLKRTFVLSKLSGRSTVGYMLREFEGNRQWKPSDEREILRLIKQEDMLEIESPREFLRFLMEKGYTLTYKDGPKVYT